MLITVIFFGIFYYNISKAYNEKDKVETFVNTLLNAYNTKLQQENHNTDSSILKNNFSLYKPDLETFKVTVIRQSVYKLICVKRDGSIKKLEECQPNGSFYGWDQYYMIFNRITGDTPIVEYNRQAKIEDYLTIAITPDQHTVITDQTILSPTDPSYYKLAMVFSSDEVLHNTEKNAVEAGNGIYAYDKNNDRTYVKIIIAGTVVNNPNKVVPSNSLMDTIRKNPLTRWIFQNSDIWYLIGGLFVVFNGYNLVKSWLNKEDPKSTKKHTSDKLKEEKNI